MPVLNCFTVLDFVYYPIYFNPLITLYTHHKFNHTDKLQKGQMKQNLNTYHISVIWLRTNVIFLSTLWCSCLSRLRYWVSIVIHIICFHHAATFYRTFNPCADMPSQFSFLPAWLTLYCKDFYLIWWPKIKVILKHTYAYNIYNIKLMQNKYETL